MASKALAVAAAALLLLSWPAQGQVFTSTSATGNGRATASGSTSTSSTIGGTQMPATTTITTPPTTPQQPAAGAAAAAPMGPPLPSQTTSLQPFTTVSLCAPVNLLILPNTTGGYAVTVQAEQPVIDGLNATVDASGALAITASGPFSTNRTIQLTVSLPADALAGIKHLGPSASVYVAPGFNVSTLNLTSASGAGQLYVNSINATQVSIDAAGVGSTTVTGTLGSVNASADGVSSVFLSGVQTGAQLTLGGSANAFVQQAPGSSITGTASGLNSVQYTAGTCSVASGFPAVAGFLFPVCTLQAFLSVPPPTPTWSCGIKVEGNFTCRPGNVLASTASGSALSSDNAAPITVTAPGGFVSAGGTGAGGTQMQAGQAVPGAASSLANVQGTGSVSASSSSTSAPGGSVASTQTSQNGVTQGFTTTSGGQTTSTGAGAGTGAGVGGVAVNYGPNDTAAATAQTCLASPADTRIPV